MAETRPFLLVGPTPPPTGGIATHVASLERALRGSGAAVEVVDPARGRMRLSATLALAALRGSQSHVHVCGHNVTSYALIGLVCGSAAPYLPPVVTIHSGLAPQFLWSTTRSGKLALGALLGRTAAVICVSREIAEAVGALGVSPNRIHVITPFVGLGAPPAAPPPELAALRARCDRICAAALAPGHEYGADVLAHGFARAASIDPRLGLVVYGPGGADRRVVRAAAAHGHGARAIALGELRHEQALGVVAAVDLFVRPTRSDGDAMSVREALHLGCAVVASDAAVRPRGVALFSAGDAQALADAILAAPPRAERAGPPQDHGLPELLRLYAQLGVSLYAEEESTPCAASPDV